MHKVSSDFQVIDSEALSRELGYEQPIDSLANIIFEKDRNTPMHELGDSVQKINVRLLSALRHSVWYSVIRPPFDGFFFFFSSKEISQLHALAKRDEDVPTPGFQTDANFMLIVSNMENGEVPSITSDSTVHPLGTNIDAMLNFLLGRTFSEDQIIIQDSINAIKRGRMKVTRCHARWQFTDLTPQSWFTLVLRVSTNTKLLLFTFYSNNVEKIGRLLQERIKVVEKSFAAARAFYCTFDSQSMGMAPSRTSTILIKEQTDIDLLLPVTFDKPRTYLFRGRSEGISVAAFSTNMNCISKLKRRTEEMSRIYNVILEHIRVLDALVTIVSEISLAPELQMIQVIRDSILHIKESIGSYITI
jgi:hypothetical protein